MSTFVGNLTQTQKNGGIKEVYLEFECSRDDAEGTKCDIESEVDVQNIDESLIPNSSNQTIKQSYTYDYQISGQDMRDEYQVFGIYLNFRCVFKIKEVDIINVVYIIGFLFVLMMLAHAIFEFCYRYNPFMKTEDSERLNDAKFDMIQDDYYLEGDEDDDSD